MPKISELFGVTRKDSLTELNLPGFQEIEEWRNEHRRVWKSDAARIIVVAYYYGYVDIVLCDNDALYEEELRRMAEFYARH
jgi:hypothetical protein